MKESELNHYWNKFYHFCFCMAKKRIDRTEIVEEIVADVFVKFYSLKLESFANDNKVKAFLAIAVIRECINYYRANLKYGTEPLPDSITEEIEEDVRLESIRAEVITAVFEEIKRLPPGAQKIFKLHFFHGQKDRDIAQELHISHNTVRAQIQRALGLIRKNISVDSFFIK